MSIEPPAAPPIATHVKIEPRGQCRTCKFFVHDADEVTAEIAHQSAAQPLLYTAERTGGEGTRPALYAATLARIFAERGVRVTDLGLCESGYDGNVWVTVQTGGAVDADGRRIDACDGWQPPDERQTRVRSAFWRRDRDHALHAAQAAASAPKTEIRPTDPCPCGSGRTLGTCCVKPNRYK